MLRSSPTAPRTRASPHPGQAMFRRRPLAPCLDGACGCAVNNLLPCCNCPQHVPSQIPYQVPREVSGFRVESVNDGDGTALPCRDLLHLAASPPAQRGEGWRVHTWASRGGAPGPSRRWRRPPRRGRGCASRPTTAGTAPAVALGTSPHPAATGFTIAAASRSASINAPLLRRKALGSRPTR